jgi:hypothetical protein
LRPKSLAPISHADMKRLRDMLEAFGSTQEGPKAYPTG